MMPESPCGREQEESQKMTNQTKNTNMENVISEEEVPPGVIILPAGGTRAPEGFGSEESVSFSAEEGTDTFSTKPTKAEPRQPIRETPRKSRRHNTWRRRSGRNSYNLLLSIKRNNGRRRQSLCSWFLFVRRRILKSKIFQNQQHNRGQVEDTQAEKEQVEVIDRWTDREQKSNQQSDKTR